MLHWQKKYSDQGTLTIFGQCKCLVSVTNLRLFYSILTHFCAFFEELSQNFSERTTRQHWKTLPPNFVLEAVPKTSCISVHCKPRKNLERDSECARLQLSNSPSFHTFEYSRNARLHELHYQRRDLVLLVHGSWHGELPVGINML